MLSPKNRYLKFLLIFAVLFSTLACVGFERTICTYLRGGEWVYEKGNFGWGGCCKTANNDCSETYQPNPVDTPGTESSSTEMSATQTSPAHEGTYNFTITSCNVTQYSDTICRCGDTDGVVEITGTEAIIQFIGRGKIIFLKTDKNTYENSRTWGEANLSIATLTLNDAGFLDVTEIYNTSTDTHLCTLEKNAIFIE